MTKKRAKAFFGEMKDWAHWKHEILSKYLRIWVSHLQSRHKELVFVDACAGAGSYGTGEVGSPVIAARLNDSCLRDNGKRLLVLAFEEHEDLAKELAVQMTPWSSRTPPEAVVYDTPFQHHLEAVVGATRNTPTLFFIDPCGLEGIQAHELAPLLEKDPKRQSTEVLLRIDPGLLARAAGFAREKPRADAEKKKAEGFVRLLKRCNISDEMIESLRAEEVGEQSAIKDKLLLEYAGLFETRFRWVQMIPIRDDYWSPPKYYLLHGTDHEDGAAKINDVVSTTEDSLFVATENREPSLFPVTEAERTRDRENLPRATIEQCANAIIEILRYDGHDGIQLRFSTVRAHLAMRFGSDLREQDHRQAVRVLRDRGWLTTDENAISKTTWLTLVPAEERGTRPKSDRPEGGLPPSA
jgi:three-Cys-motif partner protein